ncbi:hypothetical protein HAX54_043910 [Datura stramonium]|uniref:Uncharacterized protein n=1 Tax=Datura stramonium TaxID=4076 RepID=A0ABS8W373_DATST|nr:hypothetical protein [Datura stramonium]
MAVGAQLREFRRLEKKKKKPPGYTKAHQSTLYYSAYTSETMAIRISRRSNTYNARNNRLHHDVFSSLSDFGFRIMDLVSSSAFIAIPSFALLYSMDEVVVDPAITIKALDINGIECASRVIKVQRNALKLNMVREASGLPVISHSRRRETLITIACQKRGVEVVRPIPRNAPSIGAYGSILVVAGGTHPSLFSVWFIYEDAQPAMSDNGAEVVNSTAI